MTKNLTNWFSSLKNWPRWQAAFVFFFLLNVIKFNSCHVRLSQRADSTCKGCRENLWYKSYQLTENTLSQVKKCFLITLIPRARQDSNHCLRKMTYLDLPAVQPADPQSSLSPLAFPGLAAPPVVSLAAWLQLTCGIVHGKHLIELPLGLQKAISPNQGPLMPLTPRFHTHICLNLTCKHKTKQHYLGWGLFNSLHK